MTLSTDQRWLLLHMGGWAIIEALLSAHGVSHLMSSMWGSTGGCRPDGAPEWLHGWQTRTSKIYADGSAVTVSAAQINAYRATIPADTLAEMSTVRKASNAHHQVRWCHCGKSPCVHDGDPLWGGRHHPTEAEEAAHRADYWRIRDREDAVLRRALALDTGQLELFGVAS